MSNPALTAIHLCRKPLDGTVAENALKHGTGSLNIDGTRLGGGSTERPQSEQDNGQSMRMGTWQGGVTGSAKGRWPANVIFQHRQSVWYALREDISEADHEQTLAHYGVVEAVLALWRARQGDAVTTGETEVLLPQVCRGGGGSSGPGNSEDRVGEAPLQGVRRGVRGDSGVGTERAAEVLLEGVPHEGQLPAQPNGETAQGRVSEEDGGRCHWQVLARKLLSVEGGPLLLRDGLRLRHGEHSRPGETGPCPDDAGWKEEPDVCAGTSGRGRSEAREGGSRFGGGASPERGEGRQPAGEPGGAGPERPHAGASGDGTGASTIAEAGQGTGGGVVLEIEGRLLGGLTHLFRHSTTEDCKQVGEHYEDFLINLYDDSTSGNYRGYKESEDIAAGVEAESNGQMVEEWVCVEGCPVADLDHSLGTLTSGVMTGEQRGFGFHGIYGAAGKTPATSYGDSGGASRYFKQVQHEHDLIEYLRTLLNTPDKVAVVIDMDRWPDDIESWEASSVVGLVVRGAVQPEHVTEFLRLLPPGGHIALIAPDEQPTGHTGAILVEDAGFEIRDCILWVREPGRFHYVAKAARKEREAGCAKLPSKRGFEAVERKEGSAGVQNPRAEAGRTAGANFGIKTAVCNVCGSKSKDPHQSAPGPNCGHDNYRWEEQIGGKRGNHHPTVKPIELMEKLLADVPKEARVLDPFLGSGTTGIACSKQERDFVGIEREAEYLAIADARIRHWDSAHKGWRGAKIVSDHKPRKEASRELTLDDLFGDD